MIIFSCPFVPFSYYFVNRSCWPKVLPSRNNLEISGNKVLLCLSYPLGFLLETCPPTCPKESSSTFYLQDPHAHASTQICSALTQASGNLDLENKCFENQKIVTRENLFERGEMSF